MSRPQNRQAPLLLRRKVIWTVLFSAAFTVATFGSFAARSSDRRVSLRPLHEAAWLSDSIATVTGVLPRLAVIHAWRGLLYGVEDHFVYASKDSGRTFSVVGRLPKPPATGFMTRVKDVVARARPVRLVRKYWGPAVMTVLESGTILVFYDRIYRLPVGAKVFDIVSQVPGDGVGPFPGNSVAVGQGDTVYFGGYTTARRPHAVRIVRGADDGRRWEVAYTFPSGAILHVHSVTYDPFRHRYWVATGDQDAEIGLRWTDDGFRTLHTLGGGSQEWRVVSLVPQSGSLLWGSDNDRTGAAVYRYDFATSRLEELRSIGDPSYFAGTVTGGWLIVTTTYEPRSPYTRLGPRESVTSVWASQDGSCWRQVVRLDGVDRSTPYGPARPQIRVPGGDGSATALYLAPRYTVACAFCTLRLHLRPAPAGDRSCLASRASPPGP